MTALTFTELEGRASAIDSMLTLARVHLERNAAALGSMVYVCWGNYQFSKLVNSFNSVHAEIKEHDLRELGDTLDRVVSVVGPHVRRIDPASLNALERIPRKSVLNLVTRVEKLVVQIRLEENKRRKLVRKGSPALPPQLYRDAIMASVMLRPTTPDPVERHPDPDYGF